MMLRHLLLTLALIALPTCATAQVRPWLAASVGGATYSMSDVNEDIDTMNAFLAANGVAARMNDVSSGLNLGAAFGFDFADRFTIGVGYDRLSARSEASDATGSIAYELPANLLRVFGRIAFTSTPQGSAFLELGLGRVTSAGEVTLTAIGAGSQSESISGSGLALEASVGGRLWAAPRFGVTGTVGFRRAEVGDVEVGGLPIYTAAGGDYTVDYSGAFVRAAVTLGLAP